MNLFNTLTVMQQNQIFTNTSTVNMYAVEEIYANVWQYNVTSPSGQLAFGIESQFLQQ
jgi:hypothetical protein